MPVQHSFSDRNTPTTAHEGETASAGSSTCFVCKQPMSCPAAATSCAICYMCCHTSCLDNDLGEQIENDYICEKCVSENPMLKKIPRDEDAMNMRSSYARSIIKCAKIERESEACRRELNETLQERERQLKESEFLRKSPAISQRSFSYENDNTAIEFSNARFVDEFDRLKRKVDELVKHSTPKNEEKVEHPPRQIASTSYYARENNEIQLNTTDAVIHDPMAALAKMLSRNFIENLPKFAGNAKKWIDFDAAYQSTSEQGGFSKRENVDRLRKALEGDARALVEDQLPICLDGDKIMETLREFYGKPNIIIIDLMRDIMASTQLDGQPNYKIREYAVKIKNYVAAAKQLDKISELTNEFTLSHIVSKLPIHLRTAWAKIKAQDTTANIERFAIFVMDQVKLLPFSEDVGNSKRETNHKRVNAHHENSTQSPQCLKCKKFGHKTFNCNFLKRCKYEERAEFVRLNSLCFSCLDSTEHGWRLCPNKKKCSKCERHHHPLLHNDDVPRNRPNEDYQNIRPETQPRQNLHAGNPQQPQQLRQLQHHQEPQSYEVEPDIGNCFNGSHWSLGHQHTLKSDQIIGPSSKTLFKIIPVKLFGENNTSLFTYAFLDDGSSATLIEEELFHRLKYEGKKQKLSLQWTQDVVRTNDSYVTSILLSGTKNKKTHRLTEVNTIRGLNLPRQTVNSTELKNRYNHLRDIPICEMKNVRPQLLIGNKHAKLIAGNKTRSGDLNEPVAVKTELGWTVFGGDSSSLNICALNVVQSETHKVFVMTEPTHFDEEIHQIVKDYIAVENFGVTANNTTPETLTKDERIAKEIIKKTLKFHEKRAEIGLLWKSESVTLPNSFPMAMKRLVNIEKSLSKNLELCQWTNNHVKAMLEKNHARVATESDMNTRWERVAYIPIFTIVNANKFPPKPRFIMDFAAKTNGVSVNSQLLKGPENLIPMVKALFKFREQKVCVNADVKEMFNQIEIKSEDQQCQRFLWRDCDSAKLPTTYIFQRMAFGPTCSPSCAQEVKNVNAEQFRELNPEAVNAIINSTYVDDYFNSHPTVEEALKVSRDAISIFENAGFPLVGFQSNDDSLLQNLPTENVKQSMISIDGEERENMYAKILGMFWEPSNDCFTYKLLAHNMDQRLWDNDHHPTKREVLRVIMKIFDPLGLISHYLIRGKMILQSIWFDGTDWDEKIHKRLLQPWHSWLTELKNIEMLKIQRWYAPVNPLETNVQLIVFVDASDKAYAASAYLRFTNLEKVHVAQVMSKARVAPLKQISIPKLELLAALMGVRLAEFIKCHHDFDIEKVCFISDSRTVLLWITSENIKLPPFVAPRIGAILEASTRSEWNHGRSRHNVADDATKINEPKMGNVNTRWFKGPDFLLSKPEEWPIQPALEMSFAAEYSLNHLVNIHNEEELSFTALDEIGSRFKSNWLQFVRIVARIIIMLNYQKIRRELERMGATISYLNARTIQLAEDLIFRKIQFEAFPEEVTSLLNGNIIQNTSKILRLTPFIGSDGVMRAGLRTQQAKTSYAGRNPPILPSKHEFVEVMIKFFHEKNMHLGEDSTIADILERAWVIGARSSLRRVKSNCQHCKNTAAQPQFPLMGELPAARLDFESKPFTHTGLDCFGPYDLIQRRNHIKRWVIIFTCLTFRAIHLEVLNDLTSSECLAAIRRLIARRGNVSQLYSDRGTNFVGADNQMNRDVDQMSRYLGETVAQDHKITWHFIPSYSPWFGGAWERLIQSVKKCLEFVCTGETLREDVFRNALIEAEYFMNNRPLTHIPINAEDEPPLTPNNALFGDNSPQFAPGIFRNQDSISDSVHRRSQHVSDKMVSRWIREYLPTIARRTRWYTDVESIKVDDIVISIEPQKPRNTWKKGRVIKIHPGPDGKVRAADIILGDGTIKPSRSVGRLAKLDVKRSAPVRDSVADEGENVVETSSTA